MIVDAERGRFLRPILILVVSLIEVGDSMAESIEHNRSVLEVVVLDNDVMDP